MRDSRRRRDEGRLAMTAFLLSIAAALAWAWIRRRDDILLPEDGPGYLIGLSGALMMLALLGYPLRKRLRLMRGWGSAATWFRWHMILGVLGPALIIIHSDFTLQSTNATVAFASMLTVAGSGLVGRYLYGQIHRGLYGQRLEARVLRDEAIESRDQLGGELITTSVWRDELTAFEARALSPTPTLGSALVRAAGIGGLIRRNRKAAIAAIEDEVARAAAREGWSAAVRRQRRAEALGRLASYHATVRRAATLGIYERLFSLWHVAHVPLFVILVLTAIIHVIAVHLY